MKRLIIGIVFLALLVAGVSCASSTKQNGSPGSYSTSPSVGSPPAPMAPGASRGEADVGVSSPAMPSDAERLIVRTADMYLVVSDVLQARDGINQVAAKFEGYVVSSQVTGEEEEMRGWISIRVLDDKLDQAMAEIRGLAVRIKSESTSSQDVTEEYVDLDSRLNNALATEEQYLSLLNKATDVDDILRIYQSLSQVRQEIEQIKGRMQYLERTSSMALISVRLEPELTAKPLVKAGWNALEVLKSAVRGIVTFGQVLGTIGIWLLIFLPVWGTVLGVILWRRRKKA